MQDAGAWGGFLFSGTVGHPILVWFWRRKKDCGGFGQCRLFRPCGKGVIPVWWFVCLSGGKPVASVRDFFRLESHYLGGDPVFPLGSGAEFCPRGEARGEALSETPAFGPGPEGRPNSAWPAGTGFAGIPADQPPGPWGLAETVGGIGRIGRPGTGGPFGPHHCRRFGRGRKIFRHWRSISWAVSGNLWENRFPEFPGTP